MNAQEYESDHEETSGYDDAGEYHAHPDYSKYYSVDTSAPTSAAANGFVGALSGFNQPNGEYNTFNQLYWLCNTIFM